MTKPKHSPLPWHVSEQNKLTIWASPYLHRIAEACIPPDGSMDRKEAYANARFIVQSVNRSALFDEMLKELEAVHSNLINHSDEKSCRMCKLLNRAEAGKGEK